MRIMRMKRILQHQLLKLLKLYSSMPEHTSFTNNAQKLQIATKRIKYLPLTQWAALLPSEQELAQQQLRALEEHL